MRGKAVFYPMGWDDNGLPTERRVQNYYGVRCDPSLPYDPAFVPPDKPGKQPIPVSRPNFIELCERLTGEDEKAFEHAVAPPRPVGRLVDDLRHDRHARRSACRSWRSCACSQRGHRLPARGADAVGRRLPAPRSRRPSSRTASMPGAYHRIRFAQRRTAGVVEIDTTRPELIPACVALVAHPDDERYKPLFGQRGDRRRSSACACRCGRTRWPIPRRARGIAMICTFGDVTDVTWWRELALPVRAVIQANGTFRAGRRGAAPGWESVDAGARAGSTTTQLAGLSATKARAQIVELLRESRRPARRAAADHARGEVLREGRPPARDRHEPPVVHQDDRVPRGAARARARAAVASRRTCGAATRTG